MKKIFFIILLVCMILSCEITKKGEDIPLDLEIYQTSGIKETVAYLEKMGRKEPLNKAYYLAKTGYYYIEEQDYEKAESILKKALEINENEGFAYNELGYLYSIQFAFTTRGSAFIFSSSSAGFHRQGKAPGCRPAGRCFQRRCSLRAPAQQRYHSPAGRRSAGR